MRVEHSADRPEVTRWEAGLLRMTAFPGSSTNVAEPSWWGWKRVARRMGDAQARILLTLFYYVVLGPFALVLRAGSDPLALTPGGSGGWHPRDPPTDLSLEGARRQS